MSLNIGPSDASQSFNNKRHHYPKARHTIWTFLMAPFKTKRDAISQPNPPINNHPNTSITSSSSTTTIDDLVLSKLSKDLIFMEENLAKLNNFVDHVNKQISHLREKIQELKTTAAGGGGSSSSNTELGKLKKTIAKLKSQIPLNLKIYYLDDSDDPHRNHPWGSDDGSNNGSKQTYYVNNKATAELRNKGQKVEYTTVEEFYQFFRGLSTIKKLCLFRLLIFPENAIIKKSLVLRWWTGTGLRTEINQILLNSNNNFFDDLVTRGFIEPVSEKRSSIVDRILLNSNNNFFDDLVTRGFIEPVSEKRSSIVDSCRIHPLFRSALTDLAEEAGFRYDDYYFLSQPNFGSATVYDDPQLLSNMKNAKILHLGQWQQQQHIEVANIKFFDGLKNMKHHLTFLSLRGISLITVLPSIICELTNLEVLDLRACHNLESLPNGIGLLQKLIHLDMSECYFLEHMPEALASLQELQVLKGFFIRDSHNKSSSCTLSDLSRLQYLRKLNIYTSVKYFPTENDLSYLFDPSRRLEKLTISWGGCSLLGVGDEETVALTSSAFTMTTNNCEQSPTQLKKLDLQGFPWTTVPNWLRTHTPSSLKKLYIRGGQLCNLPKLDSVEILSLRYLNKLEMNWGGLQELFPNLNYLEKVDCPNLTGFPSDESFRETEKPVTVVVNSVTALSTLAVENSGPQLSYDVPKAVPVDIDGIPTASIVSKSAMLSNLSLPVIHDDSQELSGSSEVEDLKDDDKESWDLNGRGLSSPDPSFEIYSIEENDCIDESLSTLAVENSGPQLSYDVPKAVLVDIDSIPTASVVSKSAMLSNLSLPVIHDDSQELSGSSEVEDLKEDGKESWDLNGRGLSSPDPSFEICSIEE